MRIAVSGSHGAGKSTLIATFLGRCPDYLHEPEAFETIGDDIELTASGEPTPEGLQALLDYTVASLESHATDACVVFERSPVDYLAYAVASRSPEWRSARQAFLDVQVEVVRAALRRLDVIAYLPVSAKGPVQGRPGEDARFRDRVDQCLRRALFDDEHDLLDVGTPSVVELPPRPERQLAALVRLAGAAAHA